MAKLYEIIPNFYGGSETFNLKAAEITPQDAGRLIAGEKEPGMSYWLLIDGGQLFFHTSLPENGYSWEAFEGEPSRCL